MLCRLYTLCKVFYYDKDVFSWVSLPIKRDSGPFFFNTGKKRRPLFKRPPFFVLDQPATMLGSQVTMPGNTVHRIVTKTMMRMNGITPRYTSVIFTSSGRMPLT